MNRLIIFFILQIITFHNTSCADIADVFKDCSVPGQSGDNNAQQNIVADDIVGSYKNQNCKAKCDVLSTIYSSTNSELNADIISDCENLCKQNQPIAYLFSKRTFTITNKPKQGNVNGQVKDGTLPSTIIKYSTPKSIVFATTTINNGVNDKYFNIDLNNEIITLKLNTSYENIVYACGRKQIQLDPLLPNMFEISPNNVFGGNANEITSSVDNKDTFSNKLLKSKYVGIKNFNYDEYIASFEHKNKNFSDFTVLKQTLFCDIYQQQVATKGYGNSCSQFAKDNQFDDQVFCVNCNRPDVRETYRAKVRTGDMSASACFSQTNNPDYCYVNKYNLISINDFREYTKIDKVTLNNISFYKSPGLQDEMFEWDDDTMKYHPCFAHLTSSLKNKELIKFVNTDPNNPMMANCYPDWHMYNDKYIDTGIQIANGDFLKIRWGGDIILGNGLNMPFIHHGMAKMIGAGSSWMWQGFSSSPLKKALDKFNFLGMMSTLEFDNLNPLIGESGALPSKNNTKASYGNYNGNNNEIKNAIAGEICNGVTIYDSLNSGTYSEWYGLKGQILRTPGTKISTSNACELMSITGDNYEFSGNLSGVTDNQPLKIRHYIPRTKQEKLLYENSIIAGGQQVFIDWGGCPMQNGEGLKIALGNSDSKEEELKWQSITSEQIKNGYKITPKSAGIKDANLEYSEEQKIFLKIDTSRYASRIGTFKPSGGYAVKITRTQDISNDNIIGSTTKNSNWDVIRSIAETVFTTLIGNVNDINKGVDFDGVIVKLSSELCKSISTIVKVILALYITILGISFLIGTTQLNQKEIIGILIKVGFVMMILSPNAWSWFVQTYIRLFIVGSLKLALELQNIFYSTLSKKEIINTDVLNLFSTWKLWFYVLQKTFTVRLVALIFSSLAGFFIAVVIIIGTVVSFKMILEAMLVYISAMITQGVLLIIAPFFIVMKLFKITNDMFDNWAKQVIAFAIIPAGVVVTITMFLLLITIGLDAVMNFSYCTACFVEINIFGWKACLIAGYYVLGVIFFPVKSAAQFVLPTGLLAGALTFAVITYTGWYAVSMAVGMITRMITFRPEALNQNSMLGLGSSIAGSAVQTLGELKGKYDSRQTNQAMKREKSLQEIGKNLKKLDDE